MADGMRTSPQDSGNGENRETPTGVVVEASICPREHLWSTEPNERFLPEDPGLDWPWVIRTCCNYECGAVLLQRESPDGVPASDFLREPTVYVPAFTTAADAASKDCS